MISDFLLDDSVEEWVYPPPCSREIITATRKGMGVSSTMLTGDNYGDECVYDKLIMAAGRALGKEIRLRI